MSYQVIARKYRPQRFSDVVGQEHVTQTLGNAIQQSRIAHAYLFCGPRGTGKTTVARIFAKCLNCTGGPKVDFDDNDPRCQEITEGRSLDVLEIDGASNRGIDEIRELRETAKYAPASSRFKIYIIDEVHMLTKEAFNALLKTLEEPPAHVKFMFATTEPEKVLPTILSRCQRFDLRRIPVALIVQHLGQIAKLEKVEIDDAALYAIARGADGGMRDAECALDQLISFCGSRIVEEDVLSMFGLAAQRQILSLARSVLTGEPETALRELNDLTKHGKDLGRLLADLLYHLRNLLIFQVSKGDVKLLEVSEAEAASLKEEAPLVSTDSLTRVMEVLTDSESRLREAASKKIFIEVALLKAIQARNAVSIDTVIGHLQQMRSGGGSPSPAPAPSTRATAQPAKTQSAPAIANAPAAPKAEKMAYTTVAESATQLSEPSTTLQALWPTLLEAVGRVSAFTRSYLLEAHPISFEKDVLVIGFDPEFADQLDLVNNARTHSLLQTKLKELGHPNAQIKFIKAEAPGPRPTVQPALPPVAQTVPANPQAKTPPPPPTNGRRDKPAASPVTAVSAEDFKNDPLIQKALEIFKGQIVEVRP
jgi:DNA polymerase-3 subunit gamma/tau